MCTGGWPWRWESIWSFSPVKRSYFLYPGTHPGSKWVFRTPNRLSSQRWCAAISNQSPVSACPFSRCVTLRRACPPFFQCTTPSSCTRLWPLLAQRAELKPKFGLRLCPLCAKKSRHFGSYLLFLRAKKFTNNRIRSAPPLYPGCSSKK